MGDMDVALMLRFQNGDLSAFDELVLKYKKPLINFFYRFFWDHQLSEDCCQEVFYRLFKSVRQYQPKSKFTTFLYQIARHYLYDQLRKRKTTPELVSLDQPLSDKDGKPVDLYEKIADIRSDPQRDLERKELSGIIKKAVFSLPVKQRTVFILCENQGLRYEDVARILKIPVGTVKSRMYKATILLKENLQVLKGG